MAKWIVVLLLIGCSWGQEVCIRAIYPYESEVEVQTVLAELQHREIEAHQCGKEHESAELWFYPMAQQIESDQTYFWVSAQRVTGGVVGVYSTYRPKYSMLVWTVALHRNGGVYTERRYTGYGLRGQTKRMAKWLRK